MGRARDRASADLNGQEFILDADADTSISADTDDQIDIRIAGGDDFQFTANTFTAASGSTIAAQALTATTVTASDDLTVGSVDFFVDTSADKVGIGTATANQLHQKLTIYSSAEAGIQLQNDATGVANSTDGARISVYEDDIQYTNYESSGKHIFNGGSGTASRLEIEADGDVNVKTGNLVIGTGGKGIDFSAQTAAGLQSASATGELFDRYEEGIFTHAGNSNMTINSVSARGFYTIIGDKCFINGFVRFTHSGTDNVRLELPVASKGDITSPANGEQESPTITWFPSVNTSGGLAQLVAAYISSGSSHVGFFNLGTASGLVANNNCDSTAEFYYNLNYKIA